MDNITSHWRYHPYYVEPGEDSMNANANAACPLPFLTSLKTNVDTITRMLGNSADIQQRSFTIRFGTATIPGSCLSIDGLADSASVQTVLKSLLYSNDDKMASFLLSSELLPTIREQVLIHHEVTEMSDLESALSGLLSGDTLLLFDGIATALLVPTKGWSQRAVGEPSTENVVRGPRDGFTENIRVNTASVRRRIKHPAFRLISLEVGVRTNTVVEIGYIEGIVKEGLVDEVVQRIQKIDIDGVLESGYIEELINDSPYSPFSTIQNTERPDKVAAALLEGRVAIFVDNTPFVLTAPAYFWEFLQASDDYYNRFWAGSFYRFVRYIAFIISLVLPSMYVMLLTFHQEMIPTQLILTIASGREVVPFPVLLEALIMEIAFELMREAGLRMPKPIGQAVSIVGSLIIGQAAVQAGLVSPSMVIIVAVTGIASFVIPNYGASFAIRVLRFPLLIASGAFGLLGFATVFFMIVIHALSIRSFGESYFAPMTPFKAMDQKDIIFRLPWWSLKHRPEMAQDSRREGDSYPHPPRKGQGDE